MGVKYLPCRSIGYDHIPLDTAKKLGLRISHSHYPPDGVANYTIMLRWRMTVWPILPVPITPTVQPEISRPILPGSE